MDLEEFVRDILNQASSSDIIKSSEVKIEAPIVKVRLIIDNSQFVDVFRNFNTSTISFSLIEDKERVYSVDKDSVRDWHVHPFGSPDQHKEADKTTFEEFLNQVEKHISTS